MAASPSRAVEPLGEHATDEFFRYLDDHLRDNGDDGTGYFMPLPRDESRFPPEKVESFRAGLRTEVGRPGWRRAWIARDPGGGRIVGHVDLRAHVDRFAEHRCLLGMGVDRDHRRSGLGHTLLAHATAWATTTGCL